MIETPEHGKARAHCGTLNFGPQPAMPLQPGRSRVRWLNQNYLPLALLLLAAGLADFPSDLLLSELDALALVGLRRPDPSYPSGSLANHLLVNPAHNYPVVALYSCLLYTSPSPRD